MSRESRSSDFFVAGGTLRPDAPSYVKRPADDELFNLALSGEYCYVLTPRQMGKSSLMVRTAQRLREQRAHTVIIDLTEMGTVQAEAWYLDFVTELSRALCLSVDPELWWQSHGSLGPGRRFTDFLRDVVLREIEGHVVIFIDEIDFTLELDFSDDFFAAIRAMYNARARDPQLGRLSFVLLGVASPPDLIKDRTRTPFNIGQGITLDDFGRTDAIVLQEGLEAAHPGQSEAIFKRIYHWTNGHPYLTQRLCQAVAEAGHGTWLAERIDSVVEKRFLAKEASKEPNLEFIRDRLLNHPQPRQLLDIYCRVYKGKKVADDKQSSLHNELKLSGLVKAKDGYLQVRNQIYRRVFDLGWVRENTAVNWWPIVAGVAIFLAVLAFGAIAYNTWVGIQVQDCIANFYQTSVPEERVAYLAKLFDLQGLFGTPDYDGEARELFFGLPEEEQSALFEVKGNKIVVVIRGLYVALADVDNTNQTGPLLESMADALDGLQGIDDETRDLKTEIDSWIEGRKVVRQGLYDVALTHYDRAIAINGGNPATLYERARVLTEIREYEQALYNLDRVMGIAARSVIPAPTSPAPTTPTPAMPTATPVSLPTLKPINTSMPSTDTIPDNVLASASRTAILTPTPILVATPTPIVASVRNRVVSEFATTNQIIGAIRRLIDSNQNLVSFLENAAKSDYTNLRDFGLAPIIPTQPPYVCNPSSAYEENDRLSQACNLVFSQLYSAYPEDVEDIYYFFLDQTASVSVQLTNYQASEPGYFVIYDVISIPTPITSESLLGTETIPLENLPPGKYYVRVYTNEGSFNSEQQYQLLLLPATISPTALAATRKPSATATSSLTPVPLTPTAIVPPGITATHKPSPIAILSPVPMTFTPTATPPLGITATHKPSPTSTPTRESTVQTPSSEISAPVLLSPPDGLSVGIEHVINFSWRWEGELQEGWGFEIRIWKEGVDGDHFGAYDARDVTSNTILSGNIFTFSATLAGTYSISQHGSGEYMWTVAVVALPPDFQPIGPEATPRKLVILTGSNGDEGPGPKPPPP
jgi:tetratricopeptide (TPR) repeat protein